jgi:response regulator of citrate/malate metabolism
MSAILNVSERCAQNDLDTMTSARSRYHRRPGRYAIQKREFQRLIAELRLAVKTGHSQGQIASEIEVSPITVSYWLTGHSSTAQRKSIQRLRKFLSVH